MHLDHIRIGLKISVMGAMRSYIGLSIFIHGVRWVLFLMALKRLSWEALVNPHHAMEVMASVKL